MSSDRLLIELSARLADQEDRVERLETLEYGTLAFPSGTGGAICDVKLAGTATTVSCTPIPATFKHLMYIVAAGSTNTGPLKYTVQLDSALARYEHYVRQENVLGVGVGAGDTEAVSLIGVTSWTSPHPQADNTPSEQIEKNAHFGIIADYTQPSAPSPQITQTWFAYSKYQGDQGPNVEEENVELGGGFYTQLPLGGPVSTVRFIHGGPGFFTAGSRFTVYGL